MDPLLYLASLSPRRHELLLQIGVHHEIIRVDVDESQRPGESPSDYVLRLASAKAGEGRNSVSAHHLPRPVLGADTAVVIDGEILGKPKDKRDAGEMLSRLSARTHRVLTGVALATETIDIRLSESRVTFCKLATIDIERYWRSGEPADKAGSYGIQGVGALFVERIEGSYSGVVGLPLFETAELLREAGITLPIPLDQDRPR